MEPVEIKSGNARIVVSGTVISFLGNPVEIKFGSAKEQLKIIFSFRDETNNDKISVENVPVDDPKVAKLVLVNFKNPLGTGNTQAIKLGTLDGLPLHINYRVYDIGSGSGADKTIHYTLYQLEEGSK